MFGPKLCQRLSQQVSRVPTAQLWCNYLTKFSCGGSFREVVAHFRKVVVHFREVVVHFREVVVHFREVVVNFS